MEIFNESEWREKIKAPLWYKEVPAVMKQMAELRARDAKAFAEAKERVYSFFEKELSDGSVALGETGKDFDAERKDIDTIVIHHTHGEEAMTNERLSAMELLRLYATYYANPTYEPDKEIKDTPIYSGHFRNGRQVFYPYHWIISKDGVAEQLLFDNEIGWHSGNWEVNCRSIAIVFNANYEDARPSDVELEAAAAIIKNYKNVQKENILGHREVNPKTACPSNLFLSAGEVEGWKDRLLNLCK